MADYLTTREVARYLRLNEKKVYELVAQNQLPAARISGKWLFPQHLVDQWVAQHTIYPPTGLMGAVLEELVVVQGSDDWLLGRVAERYQGQIQVPVVTTRVGSLGGLAALGAGQAHLAGCHVDDAQVKQAMGGTACYLLTLFERHQGLIFDAARHPRLGGLVDLGAGGLRFAGRQPLSGTYRLAQTLLGAAGVGSEALTQVGPFSSHLELALAIRRGDADVGIGTRQAAEMCGLQCLELAVEPFKLAVPLTFAGHPRVAGFLEYVQTALQEEARTGVDGYEFAQLGHMHMVSGDAGSVDRLAASPQGEQH